MMRFQAALSAGLATFLVVPAIAVGDDDIASFEEALVNTNHALELLGSLRERLNRGEETVPALVLAVTEAPILDARGRDERLVALRNDVGLLQAELELLEGGGLAGAPAEASPTAPLVETASPAAPPQVHTGLDERTRRALAGDNGPTKSNPASTAPGTTPTPRSATEEERPSPEGAGYSADVVRQARACFLARRYTEGAALLESAPDEPQALYWRARCREKLGRWSEAEADLMRVLELSNDEHQTRRAETDLQFVRWQREFNEKLAGGETRGGDRE